MKPGGEYVLPSHPYAPHERDPAAFSSLTEKLTFYLSGHFLHAIFWGELGAGEGGPRGTLAADVIAQ